MYESVLVIDSPVDLNILEPNSSVLLDDIYIYIWGAEAKLGIFKYDNKQLCYKTRLILI